MAALLPFAVVAATPAHAEEVQVSPSDARATAAGPPTNFTGAVTVLPLFAPTAYSNTNGGQVSFTPGARTNWHTHPAGQTLVVTEGTGWVGQWDGQKLLMQSGDVVSIPPNVKHWHGATASTALTHVAISDQVDGIGVTWMEPVTDAQYLD